MNKKFYIGITDDNLLIEAKVSLNDLNKQHYYYKNTASYRGIIDESEGEDRAKEYLEDDDLWREAVQSDSTTLGLTDWVDEVLSVDGWQHILDVYELGNYYLEWDCIGGWDDCKKANYKHLFISKEDFDNFFTEDGEIKIKTERAKIILELFDKYNKQDHDKIAETFRKEATE